MRHLPGATGSAAPRHQVIAMDDRRKIIRKSAAEVLRFVYALFMLCGLKMKVHG
jgi:hypothetical protein